MAFDQLIDVDTPNGRVLMTRQQAQLLGVGGPPPLATTQDNALAQLAGMPPTDPVPSSPPDLTPTFAQPPPPPAVTAPAPVAPAVTAPVPAAPVAAPAPVTGPPDAVSQVSPPVHQEHAAPAPNLSTMTYSDLVARQQADAQAQAAALSKVGEAQTKELEAKAAHVEAANAELARQEVANAERAAADQAELKQKEGLWQAKQQEFLDAKVTRRHMSGMEALGAALSGLGNVFNKTSGPNPALQIAMQNIEQDVADQEKARARLGEGSAALKGSLDYASQIASNAAAARLAAVGMTAQRQARDWDAIAAKMKPGENQAKVAQAAVELRVAGTQQLGEALKLQHGDDLQNRQLAQSDAASRRSAYVTMRGQTLDKERDDRAFAANQGQRTFENEIKRQDQVLEGQKVGAAAKAAAASGGIKPELAFQMQKDLDSRTPPPMMKIERAPNGNIVGTKPMEMVQHDGKPYIFPSEKVGEELRKKLAVTQRYIDTSDTLEQLRGDAGSELFKTGAARKMLVEFRTLQLSDKDRFGLGVLAGEDMKMLDGAIGTSDPTEFRDFVEALRQSRSRAVTDLNTDWQKQGNYTGEPFEFENMNGAASGTESEAVKNATASATRREAANRVLNLPAGGADNLAGDPTVAQLAQGALEGRTIVKPITPEAGRLIDDIALHASTGDRQARADLKMLTKGPNSAYAKAKAAEFGVSFARSGAK